ncbi:MAG: WbqC family protein [Candidatus Peribacteraceae bacterium]|nr:WbqC family protein [Candidatus Peribacteraceae bacterium]
MKIAVMQPYFLPYIGYYQLINAVDKFIFYDDVNFIKGGWINRNRFLIHGKHSYITIPAKQISPNKLINSIEIMDGTQWRNKILKTVEQSYKKAPYFEIIYEIFREILLFQCQYLCEFIINGLKVTTDYLSIKNMMISSSFSYRNSSLKRQERILDICNQENVTHYINASGGRLLYDTHSFKKHGVNLLFIKSNSIIYQQFSEPFEPWLSIIDVLMFNPKEKVQSFLGDYVLQS